jgi:hypothetical protein
VDENLLLGALRLDKKDLLEGVVLLPDELHRSQNLPNVPSDLLYLKNNKAKHNFYMALKNIATTKN